MKRVLRVAFPFYRDHHNFLLTKWWFRLGIVIYIVGLFLVPFWLFSVAIDAYLNCYDTVITLFYGSPTYIKEMAFCKEQVMSALPGAVGFAIGLTVAFHYFLQLTFFKLIVDFIALGKSRVS